MADLKERRRRWRGPALGELVTGGDGSLDYPLTRAREPPTV